MAEPVIAQLEPMLVDVEAGKTYFWCACGKSQTQPFCDGSHKGGEFKPIKFTAKHHSTVSFCCCKRSSLAPLCDGTHDYL